MAHAMEYASYLAKEIGPRPAGTEEEQQAALYITEQFQKDAGFTANMEEFTSATNFEMGRTILSLVVVLATILAIIFPILAIPAFILAAAAAAVYVLEELDRPIISQSISPTSKNPIAPVIPHHVREKSFSSPITTPHGSHRRSSSASSRWAFRFRSPASSLWRRLRFSS